MINNNVSKDYYKESKFTQIAQKISEICLTKGILSHIMDTDRDFVGG